MAEQAKVMDDITISPELVLMDLQAETDQEVIGIMARHLYELGYVKESYIKAVQDREKEFYTGLDFEEMGVALPHADSVHVEHQAIAIGILKNPVTFHAMGDPVETLPVKLVFMLAIKKPDKQLDFLSRLMESCQKEGCLSGVYNAGSKDEAVDLFKKFF